MKIAKIWICFMILMLAAVSAVATQQGNLPIDDTPSLLRIVEGGLCGDVPDDSGTPSTLDDYGRVWCLGANGVTDDMTGCVVQFYDARGLKLRERVLEPGAYTNPAPYETAYWQRFNCYEEEYTCGLFESMGCGETGSYASCADDEMLRVRECSDNAPASVETERCVEMPSCYSEAVADCEFEISEWTACNNGKQSRVVTESDCSTWTDYQDCVVQDCTNPVGEPGDERCQASALGNYYVFKCKDGSWRLTSEKCEGQAETQTDATEPDTADYYAAKNLEATGWAAYYDPSLKAIVGKVKIKNNGDAMKDTHILEMQVVPKGANPFTAFISDQKTCDPDYPTNVHKQFKLDKNQEKSIELRVSQEYLQPGDYDIYFLTRHKCYVDLTTQEESIGDDFQIVPPFPGYKKFPEKIEVPGGSSFLDSLFGGDDGNDDGDGDQENDSSDGKQKIYQVVAVVLTIGGIVSIVIIGPFGMIIAAIGVLMFALQNRIFG